jgi:hypothetical protein
MRWLGGNEEPRARGWRGLSFQRRLSPNSELQRVPIDCRGFIEGASICFSACASTRNVGAVKFETRIRELVSILPGPPIRYAAVLPTLRRPSEPFSLKVKGEDNWNTPSDQCQATFELRAHGDIGGLPETRDHPTVSCDSLLPGPSQNRKLLPPHQSVSRGPAITTPAGCVSRAASTFSTRSASPSMPIQRHLRISLISASDAL